MKMVRAMTENQRMLTGYLIAVGCKKSTTVRIISQVWEADKTIKMLEFCRDNPNASEEELSNEASKIACDFNDDNMN